MSRDETEQQEGVMSEELLPCPFCNRQLEHDKAIEATRHPKIPYEEYCPLHGFLFASDRSDIIRAWNTRALPASGTEALREALEMAAQILDQRAGGYQARGGTIFNGYLIAEELFANATKIRALAALAQPVTGREETIPKSEFEIVRTASRLFENAANMWMERALKAEAALAPSPTEPTEGEGHMEIGG